MYVKLGIRVPGIIFSSTVAKGQKREINQQSKKARQKRGQMRQFLSRQYPLYITQSKIKTLGLPIPDSSRYVNQEFPSVDPVLCSVMGGFLINNAVGILYCVCYDAGHFSFVFGVPCAPPPIFPCLA